MIIVKFRFLIKIKCYTLFIVRWNTQFCPKLTECRSTDNFLTYFEVQLTDVPAEVFHVYDF